MAVVVVDVDSRMGSYYLLLGRSFRLSARELSELAEELVEQRALIDTFVTAIDDNCRRTRAYVGGVGVDWWLADPSRPAARRRREASAGSSPVRR